MKWIVFLEVDVLFKDAFIAAKELDFRIALVSKNKNNKSPLDNLFDSFIMYENNTLKEIEELIKRNIPIAKIEAFWTVKDNLLTITSRLNEKYGHSKHFLSYESLLLLRNKYEVRKKLSKIGCNPLFYLLEKDSKYNKKIDNDLIIKPIYGWSSIGIEKVRKNNNFHQAAKRTFDSLKLLSSNLTSKNNINRYSYDIKKSILVEEYIDGIEVSAEILSNNNKHNCISICSKSPLIGPYFEEKSYLCPANISSSIKNKIIKLSEKILSALNIYNGICHIEYRIDKDEKIFLVEVNPRIGGSGLSHDLVYNSTGINLVKATLAELCELPFEKYLIQTKKNIALLYLIQVESGGIVENIPDPIVFSDKHISLKKSKIFVNKKDRLIPYPNYSGLPGYALYEILGQGCSSYELNSSIIQNCDNNFKIGYKKNDL